MTAALLAVLITERGLGGLSVDLAQRLLAFRSDRSKRAEEARGLAGRWAGAAGAKNRSVSGEAGRHLARAYPDRVAQQAGGRGRYRLANGRGATLEESDPLAASPFLVVTDITGSAANGRIRAAAAIDLETIEALFAQRIGTETTLTWDAASRSVRARRVRRLQALKLDDAPVAIDDPEKAAVLLAANVNIADLPWSKDQKALRARATFLSQALGDPWPDLSDTALSANREWLIPFVTGRAALSAVTAEDLSAALDMLLPWGQRAEIDRLLPSHFAAPSGSSAPIDYEAENGPALEIRVQELFGLDRHPAVGGGKIPLLLVLLSPAHRPIQITRDLPAFWRGSWKDVAKDLKGRYPRHFWPDDPIAAQATNRAKPRGT
jgi:ATP-dependent helicase HrpB